MHSNSAPLSPASKKFLGRLRDEFKAWWRTLTVLCPGCCLWCIVMLVAFPLGLTSSETL
jgi:hypothetical protein